MGLRSKLAAPAADVLGGDSLVARIPRSTLGWAVGVVLVATLGVLAWFVWGSRGTGGPRASIPTGSRGAVNSDTQEPEPRDVVDERKEWVEFEVRVRVFDRDGVAHENEDGYFRTRVLAPSTFDRNPERTRPLDSDLMLKLVETGYIQPPGAAFQFDTDFQVLVEKGIGRIGAWSPGYLAVSVGSFRGKRLRVLAPRSPVRIEKGTIIPIDFEIND